MKAVKRVAPSGTSVARVAEELEINENTLHGWLKKYHNTPSDPFRNFARKVKSKRAAACSAKN